MNADAYFETLEVDETIQEQRARLANRDNLREHMALRRAELGPYRPDPKTWQERFHGYLKYEPSDWRRKQEEE